MSKQDLHTGRIKIVKVPAGEAPLWVREAWVGVELPCFPDMGWVPAKGALSGQKIEVGSGVIVSQDEALKLLGIKNAEAERWWRNHGHPNENVNFVFREGDIEIVSGVTHRRIIHVTDEMQGDPFR